MFVRLFAVLAVLTAVLLGTGTAGASIVQRVDQHPIGGSGIQGRILVTDTGSSNIVDGTATGLNPAHHYFSLFYTLGSHPGGPAEDKTLPPTSNAIAPCADLNQAGTSTITANQMVVGLWTVNQDGTGSIHDVKTTIGNSQDPLFIALGLKPVLESFGYVFGANSYAPAGTWATMSIRDASENFSLVACGEVHP